MQLRSKRPAKNTVVLGSEIADGRNGKNNTQTGKAIQLRLHGIQFLSEHLDLLEHRATTSAGKPVSILRVTAEKNFALPSFLVVCLVLV